MPTDSPASKTGHTPMGPTAGIVIIIVLMVMGAVYFFYDQFEQRHKVEPPTYIPKDQA